MIGVRFGNGLLENSVLNIFGQNYVQNVGRYSGIVREVRGLNRGSNINVICVAKVQKLGSAWGG